MDQATRELVAAFAMGTIGVSPAAVSERETAASDQGLVATESVAQYERAVRALAVVDAEHPEIGVRAEIERSIGEIHSGDVTGALARIDRLLAASKPYLPA